MTQWAAALQGAVPQSMCVSLDTAMEMAFEFVSCCIAFQATPRHCICHESRLCMVHVSSLRERFPLGRSMCGQLMLPSIQHGQKHFHFSLDCL